MRNALLLLAIICLTCEPFAAYDNSQKGVEQAFARFMTAFNNLDWEMFRSAFAEDVSVFNPDIPEAPNLDRIDGRRQVDESFKSVFAATRRQSSGPPYLHIVPRNIRIQTYGDSAILTFEFDRGANSIGRRTFAFHRESAGWKIAHIHASNVERRT